MLPMMSCGNKIRYKFLTNQKKRQLLIHQRCHPMKIVPIVINPEFQTPNCEAWFLMISKYNDFKIKFLLKFVLPTVWLKIQTSYFCYNEMKLHCMKIFNASVAVSSAPVPVFELSAELNFEADQFQSLTQYLAQKLQLMQMKLQLTH